MTEIIDVAEGVRIDPDIMGGVPCIAGTRIPTSSASELASAGFDVAGIMDEYPTLSVEQIANALAWQFRPVAVRMDAIAKASLS